MGRGQRRTELVDEVFVSDITNTLRKLRASAAAANKTPFDKFLYNRTVVTIGDESVELPKPSAPISGFPSFYFPRGRVHLRKPDRCEPLGKNYKKINKL